MINNCIRFFFLFWNTSPVMDHIFLLHFFTMMKKKPYQIPFCLTHFSFTLQYKAAQNLAGSGVTGGFGHLASKQYLEFQTKALLNTFDLSSKILPITLTTKFTHNHTITVFLTWFQSLQRWSCGWWRWSRETRIVGHITSFTITMKMKLVLVCSTY